MAPSKKVPTPSDANRAQIDKFLDDVKKLPAAGRDGPAGRLLFAMDATLSRQPTWDRALHIQADMFNAALQVGRLEIQLAYFRGFREFSVSNWLSDADGLARAMTSVQCRGGHTQIERVLDHALRSAQREKLKALVYVGDCVEENADDLAAKAGKLGVFGVPIFAFQEGADPTAEVVFREFARLSGGAYSRFSAASASELRDLLSAVAVFVAGGRKALANHADRSGRTVQGLLTQMKR